MTKLEMKELSGFEKTIKRYFIGGGGTVALALVAFYFNTGFTLSAHEERLDKHDTHTEKVIVLEQDVKHMTKQNEVFMRQYREDRDKIIDLLMEIKEEQ